MIKGKFLDEDCRKSKTEITREIEILVSRVSIKKLSLKSAYINEYLKELTVIS